MYELVNLNSMVVVIFKATSKQHLAMANISLQANH